jgi:hypothetical protein
MMNAVSAFMGEIFSEDPQTMFEGTVTYALVDNLAGVYVNCSRRRRRNYKKSARESERWTEIRILWITEAQLCRHNSFDPF